jgi:NADH-ubiquinone oxidoreductase chain 1
MIWLIRYLAEVNRTPFDFLEGESELVSGFNVEFGGGLFALLFIREYGNIIFFRVLSSYLFLCGKKYFMIIIILILVYVLWIRGTLVRFRYDNLMIIA